MKSIFKWTLEVTDQQVIEVPRDTEFLTVQMQRDEPQVWGLCTPDKMKVQKSIRIFGTGHPVPENPGKYLGTFQLRAGLLIFHVFVEE